MQSNRRRKINKDRSKISHKIYILLNKNMTINYIRNRLNNNLNKDLLNQLNSLKKMFNIWQNMLNNKKMLYFKNALKDVVENSDFKHYKNTSKFVKKYFKVKENLSKLM